MRKQFLIHKLGKTYLTVDITEVGEHVKVVPLTKHTSWELLCNNYSRLGATQDALDKAKAEIETNGTTRLLI
jgi:hypothetical protein